MSKSNLTVEVYGVRFQILAATSMKMAVFWDVVSCSLIEV
jgi:hypothetical protein